MMHFHPDTWLKKNSYTYIFDNFIYTDSNSLLRIFVNAKNLSKKFDNV